MSKIGFIGVGIMGSPMAGHLQRAGHSVRVYNRSGEEYEDAQVRLIVGKINLVEKIADHFRLDAVMLGINVGFTEEEVPCLCRLAL